MVKPPQKQPGAKPPSVAAANAAAQSERVRVGREVSGRGGKGVFAVRNLDGSWSDPVFITLAGVNVGFQWGVQSTDVVFVLMSRKSVEGIADGKVTLGADASVAAGPVGRSAAAPSGPVDHAAS